MAVHDDCKMRFLELKAKRTHHFIVFKIEEKQNQVVVEKVLQALVQIDVLLLCNFGNDKKNHSIDNPTQRKFILEAKYGSSVPTQDQMALYALSQQDGLIMWQQKISRLATHASLNDRYGRPSI
ncbi:hypothetical protein Fot_38988 [Forsythia ovata]|uniref:ADF-H domain-containing protein n=1 Tax=Forsythia ovata TaxID=205694 RepID=A0ABD1S3C3_9LAMI